MVTAFFWYAERLNYDLVELCLAFIPVNLSVSLFIFFYMNRALFRNRTKEDPNEIELINYLKNIDDRSIVLTIPVKLSFSLSYQLINKNNFQFYYLFVTEKVDGFKYMEEEMVEYNMPIYDLQKLVDKYQFNVIVISKKHIEGHKYDFDGLKPIFEVSFDNSDFFILERR